MIKDYYSLTKGGLVLGNIITVLAGFALGARGHINFILLLATVLGIYLVMASGCVFNNYIDRDIDGLMRRTKDRVLVKKSVSPRGAFVFGIVLGVIGFFILARCTNFLTLLVALIGFIFYVFIYSLWGKRRSVYGTILGSVSGATPPVVGYCAATGRFDVAALILFFMLVTWQMPHFFAIAIRRKEDYAAAGIPVMPVAYGVQRTKISMFIYIIEFVLACSLLTIFGYAGYIYLAIALVLGLLWLGLSIKGLSISGDDANKLWARQMFFFSLIVMMVIFITIGVGAGLG
jgi:protoheme IX farnesyltransferase